MDFFARIAENPIVLTIPILGAIIGWVERWAAIRMMFYPTEFVGIKPFLGWQGIVPANAKRLARMSTRLILTKLLTLEELFASFKGDAFAKEMKPVVDQITNQVIDEVAVPCGWQGWVGCEYRPRAGTSAGLGWRTPPSQ